MARFNNIDDDQIVTPAVELQAPARQILSYHYDGFHHLKMVDAEKAYTNSAVQYYRTAEEFAADLTASLANHLTWIGVLPASLGVGITADTEEDWDNKYVEAVIKWITENKAMFSANLKLAVSPKPGYIARKYVPTKDDWHPTCDNNCVMVRFVQLLPDPKAGYRIAVWGGDDFGLEKDLPTFDSASALYKELTEGGGNLTIQSLLDKGFAPV